MTMEDDDDNDGDSTPNSACFFLQFDGCTFSNLCAMSLFRGVFSFSSLMSGRAMICHAGKTNATKARNTSSGLR